MKKKGRVVAAMSGGVDSSVAAALLCEEGYEVIGVTMQIWPKEAPEEELRRGGCCSLSAVHDARRVADALGIPYYVINLRDVFREKVIDRFVDEYRRGRTPNPCLQCNFDIKWDALLKRALELEADWIATGHYARVLYDEDLGRWQLLKGVDRKKDQSYFLYGLTQEQLSRTLFPVGGYLKSETRELAKKFGLAVAEKEESQEICFVDSDYRSFLEKEDANLARSGPLLDRQGRVLGRHRGIHAYTVGQRRGLGIAAGKPMYVVRLDPDENAVVLGDEPDLYSRGLFADEVNSIETGEVPEGARVTAKIRYRARETAATLYPEKAGRWKVLFDRPQRAVTPGQAVVLYRGERVFGGGTIAEVIDDE